MTPIRDASALVALVQGGSSGGDEKGIRNMLRTELTGIADGLTLSFETERKVKNDSEFLASATGRAE